MLKIQTKKPTDKPLNWKTTKLNHFYKKASAFIRFGTRVSLDPIINPQQD